MTTLAQLHDCHSCNDERSIVQKKKGGREDSTKAGGHDEKKVRFWEAPEEFKVDYTISR